MRTDLAHCEPWTLGTAPGPIDSTLQAPSAEGRRRSSSGQNVSV